MSLSTQINPTLAAYELKQNRLICMQTLNKLEELKEKIIYFKGIPNNDPIETHVARTFTSAFNKQPDANKEQTCKPSTNVTLKKGANAPHH